MNSKFTQYVKDLTGGDEVAKETALNEIHKTFAYLSTEDQIYAQQFLFDVENGLVLDSTKTFKDYITDYKVRAHNDQVHKIAVGLGINEDKLHMMMSLHLNATTINEFGRYDDLISELDIGKARVFLEKRLGKPLVKAREVKLAADSFLRKIIIEGL